MKSPCFLGQNSWVGAAPGASHRGSPGFFWGFWETGLQFVGEVGNHNNDGVDWRVISRDPGSGDVIFL